MDEQILAQLRSLDPGVRRNAIVVLGRSLESEALAPLEVVYRTDPNPELRALALKAIQYIEQNQQVSLPSPSQAVDVSPDAARRAKQAFSQALDAHIAGDQSRAQKELSYALSINPYLAEDEMFINLAGQVMNATPTPSKQPQSSARKTVSRMLLVIALLVLVILIIWFVESGLLARYKLAYQAWRLKEDVHYLANGQEYYLLIPNGDPPPDGWAVVVAMHGYGGDGLSALNADFFTIANEERAIIILPTFADYDDDDNTISQSNIGLQNNLSAILDTVAREYPVNSRGAVLYGFSRGGMFATEYFSNHSNRVYAIVAEAAPQVIVPPGGAYIRPCVFLYGENDGLQNYTYSNIQQWKTLGFPVIYEIVPGAGHQVTPRGMAWVRAMVQQVHAG